jgi:hypothetical protein
LRLKPEEDLKVKKHPVMLLVETLQAEMLLVETLQAEMLLRK